MTTYTKIKAPQMHSANNLGHVGSRDNSRFPREKSLSDKILVLSGRRGKSEGGERGLGHRERPPGGMPVANCCLLLAISCPLPVANGYLTTCLFRVSWTD